MMAPFTRRTNRGSLQSVRLHGPRARKLVEGRVREPGGPGSPNVHVGEARVGARGRRVPPARPAPAPAGRGEPAAAAAAGGH
ncbi:expressed unknown protein [Ectocarpus siliculosus]|uniref:Uncharacterized protein n=1 Tax=Ectocarpus siliculosus TaxID=2880 RepID=D8LEG0_ECTSI|nr:expressed unknown protein [Ectocarpus siliculosus]|eukprot:CBN80203.1 expressed unknown protein [Ectocarpus siliculosus]